MARDHADLMFSMFSMFSDAMNDRLHAVGDAMGSSPGGEVLGANLVELLQEPPAAFLILTAQDQRALRDLLRKSAQRGQHRPARTAAGR